MDSNIEDQLTKLRLLYLKELPGKLTAILDIYQTLTPESWHTENASTLHRLIHSLTGSAGTFGLQSISIKSRVVEKLLAEFSKTGKSPNAEEWGSIQSEMHHLHELINVRLQSDAMQIRFPSLEPRNNSHPLVYIVEDDPDHLDTISRILTEEGFRIKGFATIESFREQCNNVDAEQPSALIMDLIFPEGDTAGSDIVAELKSGNHKCPPVIFVSARDDITARLQAFRSGASRYLAKPVSPGRLIDLLDEVTGRQPASPYKILMVDDDEMLLELQAGFLNEAGMQVHTLSNPLQILEAFNSFQPDVVVLDVYMPKASGPELAAILREREDLQNTPILFLSAETDISQQLLALNLGGDDFLVKPVQPDHLVAAVTARARRARQNIAMQKRLETTLYEREREHHALNQHAIVSITDNKGNITYANQKFCDISGYERNELIGQNHRLLKSGKHAPEFYRDLWRTISSGKVWQGEVCNRCKDGSLYWVESTVTPFVDKDGKPYQYISIRTDITQIKLAEAELQEKLFELGTAQSLAHIGSWTADFQTGQGTWSDETYRIFGHTPGTIENPSQQFHKQIHPDDKEMLLAASEQVKVEGHAEYEHRLIRPDGTIRHVLEQMYAINDGNGNLIGLRGITQDITERLLAANEVKSSRERLRRGQEYANIGTWDWNIQTGELYWTDRIAPLFGYPVGELETTYENFVNAIHPDDRKLVTDAVSACVEKDIPYNIEHRVVWPDGTVRWLMERGAVARDAAGKPLQMLGVVQDIDDRKRAELSLIEREKQLREAQQLAHIGNWTANMSTGELQWSDEIYRIFGYEPGTIEPSVEIFRNAIHPDDVKLVERSEENAKTTGQHNIVHRILWPDGTIRYVHELASAELDSAGNLLRLRGTVQDVTEQIEAEARLRESEERFSFAVEGAGDGIWDWNMLSGEMQLSGHYESMLGFVKGELEPTIDAWVKSVHPEDLPGVQASLEEYLSGKSQHYNIELRLLCKDGGYKWVLCRGTIVERNSAGKAIRMIGIHSDITDRKAVEAALIAASEEANRANRAKSEFLSSMSHELRTPMNAILGFAQLLKYDESLNEENQDNVEEIIKAGDHLLDLINEVLDLAKVESGHLALSLEAVEICNILDECLALIGILAEKRKIRVTHDHIQGVIVKADRTRLKQVVLNLLSNAIKYNREGGSVYIDTQLHGDKRILLRIKDTGPGIPQSKLAELFQPFNRLGAENSGIEGTGIGLTLSLRLIEMMGGTITVQSEEGIGSTFTIDLPLDSLPDGMQSHALQNSNDNKTYVPQTGNTDRKHLILYIEDNPSNLRLMAQVLGKRDHTHLLTAHTPELGIELARARLPELILLDINMPGMDGFQVLSVLRADDALKHIPVIAVTANAMPRDKEKGMQSGFNDYLTKPIDITRLFLTLDLYLDK